MTSKISKSILYNAMHLCFIFFLMLFYRYPAHAASSGFDLYKFTNPVLTCDANCYLTVSVGRYLKSEMPNAFGLERFEPPTQWRFGNSVLVSGSAGRPFLRYLDWAQLEWEFGLGKRAGDLKAVEVWGAIYFRWLLFPWSDYLRTSLAVSTGLSYTPTIDLIERIRVDNGLRGSRLLHYLSPEITFGLPSQPNLDLVIRYHHRSGGRYYLIGPSEIFNDAAGGAQYLTFGIRVTL
jgi:hypothetical protein